LEQKAEAGQVDPDAKTRRANRVYEALRREIITGIQLPGMRLVLRELAERYGTSVFPVREALRMLEQDGLVESTPHQGARVATLKASEIEETFLIRSAVEKMATELAVPYLTDADFESMKVYLSQQKVALENNSHDKLAEKTRRFHDVVFDACPSVPLRQLCARLRRDHLKFRAVLGYEEGREKMEIEQHEHLLAALMARDVPAAGELARAHRWATAEALINYVKERERLQREIATWQDEDASRHLD
jgi:DNA-binding GntR family transcriptional regulator